MSHVDLLPGKMLIVDCIGNIQARELEMERTNKWVKMLQKWDTIYPGEKVNELHLSFICKTCANEPHHTGFFLCHKFTSNYCFAEECPRSISDCPAMSISHGEYPA